MGIWAVKNLKIWVVFVENSDALHFFRQKFVGLGFRIECL